MKTLATAIVFINTYIYDPDSCLEYNLQRIFRRMKMIRDLVVIALELDV